MNQDLMSLRTSRSGLARLTRIGVTTIEAWIAEGLPLCGDGRIALFRTLQWLHRRHEEGQRQKALLTKLSQIQLAELLDVRRQSVYEWTRLGLPRGEDKTYSLPVAMVWIRLHYRQRAEAKYQKHLRTLSADLERKASCKTRNM